VKNSLLGIISIFLILSGIVIGLPLLGSMVRGDRPIACYLEFPPRLGGVEHAPFSWSAFVGLAAFILILLLPFIRQAVRTAGKPGKPEKLPNCRFPWWGYAGAAVCIAAWVLAWNRFSWFAEYQPYTFPFLWVGYIVAVNALTYKRTGS